MNERENTTFEYFFQTEPEKLMPMDTVYEYGDYFHDSNNFWFYLPFNIPSLYGLIYRFQEATSANQHFYFENAWDILTKMIFVYGTLILYLQDSTSKQETKTLETLTTRVSEELKYVSTVFVFDGLGAPLSYGSRINTNRLYSGDNFIYVMLPEIPEERLNPQFAQSYLSSVSKEITTKYPKLMYSAVAVETSSVTSIHPYLSNYGDPVPTEKLLEKPNIDEVKFPNTSAVLFSREQFERFGKIDAVDPFFKCVDVMASQELTDLCMELKKDPENSYLRERINSVIKGILFKNVESILGGSYSASYGNVVDVNEFGRRSSTMFQLTNSRNLGRRQLRSLTTNGRLSTTYLNTVIFGPEGLVAIYDLIRTNSDYVENTLSKHDDKRILRAALLGLELLPLIKSEDLREIKEENLDLTDIKKAKPLNFKSKGILNLKRRKSIIAFMVLVSIANIAPSIIVSKFPKSSEQPVVSQTLSNPDIKDDPSKMWKITGTTESVGGYYITDTSRIFDGKEWKNIDGPYKVITLPEEVKEKPGDSVLKKDFQVSSLDNFSFKIPLHMYTQPVALNIHDENGDKVSFEIQKLSDGTYRVEIKKIGFLRESVISVEARLRSVDLQYTVKIVGAGTQVGLSEMSPEVRSALENARKEKSKKDITFQKAIVDQISHSKTYSLSSATPNFKSAAEFVNAQQSSKYAYCLTANSLAVLEGSNDPLTDSALATGYLIGGDSKSAFITTLDAHAFTINDDGVNLVIDDATPIKVGKDTQTKSYIKQQEQSTYDEELKKWNKSRKDMHDNSKQKNEWIDGITILSALVLGGVIFKKRNVIINSVKNIKGKVIFKNCSSGELALAYNTVMQFCFSDFSFSTVNRRDLRNIDEIMGKFKNKEEMLLSLRSNVPQKKLRALKECLKYRTYRRRLKEMGIRLSILNSIIDYIQI